MNDNIFPTFPIHFLYFYMINFNNMNMTRIMPFIIIVVLFSCRQTADQSTQTAADPHSHETQNNDEAHQDHAHDISKIQFTAYSDAFEVFAEADPFIVGQQGNILAHFSYSKDFKALETGQMQLVLNVGNTSVSQTLEKPSRKGIYSFDIIPEFSGKAQLQFLLQLDGRSYEINVPDQLVFKTKDDAVHAPQEEVSKVNTISFTKEQSWKINFKTEHPVTKPFGKVFKAVGQIQTPKCEELILTAKNDGILLFPDDHLIEGKKVHYAQKLFSVSSNDFIDNNMNVRLDQAKIEMEKAEKNYNRIKALLEEKIVGEIEFIEAKNQFQNASLNLETIRRNFNPGGQYIKSPMNGFIKSLFVQNGQYVEAGQAIASVINNAKILITADIDLKNASLLDKINSVTVNNMHEKTIRKYTDLNSSVLTVGQHTNPGNFMVPISLELDNEGKYIPGSFVDLYIQTMSNEQAVIIPNGAIMEEQGKYFVFEQVNPELFEKKYILMGATDGVFTEIISGVSNSKRIVSEGAIFIKLSQTSGALDAHAGHVH